MSAKTDKSGTGKAAKKTETSKAKATKKPKTEPKAPAKSKAKATKTTTKKAETKQPKQSKPTKHKPTKRKAEKITKKSTKQRSKALKTEKKLSAAKQGQLDKQARAKKPGKFVAGTKEVNLYSTAGKSLKKIKLPTAFDEIYRRDLIRRAVKAARANRRQPYGPSPNAGMSHPSSTWGKGRGVARVQRQVSGRRAVESPNNVGGRRAHPPTVEKVWAEKINKKERKKARRAALAAISDSNIVTDRGHKFDKKISLPLILEDGFEKINKTKTAIEVFEKLGVYDDIVRARDGKHIRAGKGKSRGRKFRTPKSILIISQNNTELVKGTGNLSGIDVVTPSNLSVEDLAPGGDPGRLTIITESALKMIGEW
jgi:large subunit ribosomal protein L4e